MLQIPALLSQPEHKLIVQIVGHRLTHQMQLSRHEIPAVRGAGADVVDC